MDGRRWSLGDVPVDPRCGRESEHQPTIGRTAGADRFAVAAPARVFDEEREKRPKAGLDVMEAIENRSHRVALPQALEEQLRALFNLLAARVEARPARLLERL